MSVIHSELIENTQNVKAGTPTELYGTVLKTNI